MKTCIKIFVVSFLFITCKTKAQPVITNSPFLHVEIEEPVKTKLTTALDSLFSHINRGTADSSLLDKTNYPFNLSLAGSLKAYEKKDSIKNFYKKQLINFYALSSNEYFITIAYIGAKSNEVPELKAIVNLVAKNENGKITFAIPLDYATKHWILKKVGDVSYYFPYKLNTELANTFAAKNTLMATKLGLKPEKLRFYMCENYQEILKLQGYAYDAESSGRIKDGYGVGANTIFSIMNNEDFSHDLFHYYSAKIRGEAKRNRTVEEGMAYYWGNAYYANENGKMIEQKELVNYLKQYIKENPDTSLLDLFTKDTKLFKHIPEEISVKSTISSLLCKEVEQKKGIQGIKKLICCGKGDEAFFKTLDELITVNTTNFNKEVRRLIEQYK